jgi:phosphate starvation-inducible PhoH-like protein
MKFLPPFLLMVASSYSLKNCKYNPSLMRNNFPTRLYSKKERTRFSEYLYKPKNANQEKYVKYLNDEDLKIIVSVGPAGTGKTMFACMKAIQLLKSGSLNKIIITRPIVAVEEEELGFLPGNLVKKMDPWTRPIMDIFMEYYPKSEIDNMIYTNTIEISPLAYMRGRTFKNAFIIADEMQNSTPNQMLMLTTRIGSNSKLVVTGDLKQVDRTVDNNGLHDFIQKIKNYRKFHDDSSIELIEFKKEDIERSEIVQKVIDIYQFVEPIQKVVVAEQKREKKEEEKREINGRYIENDAALIPWKDTFRK